jgi:hypothetical protein
MSAEGQTVDLSKGRRTRRRNIITSDAQKTEIVNRVLEQYEREIRNRGPERDRRLQRYAKYRLWTTATDWPWPDASNSAIPDMLQDSLRVQDTLHNAVMSQKPPVTATATAKADEPKAKIVDDLIQTQIFVEQPGEKAIGDMVESFVNDPAVTVFIPWVRDKRKVSDARIYDAIPDDATAKAYFLTLVKSAYPESQNYTQSADGWDCVVERKGKEDLKISFYTNEDDEVEMVATREMVVYDGPRLLVKDYEDVLYPARSANLQAPGPSNPGGAPWVIMRDWPVANEITRLQASGYYDAMSADEAEKLGAAQPAQQTESNSRDQKDTLSGAREQPGTPPDKGHKTLTRLTSFDTVDIEGKGVEEDVVIWILKETKQLLRVRRLSDVNPGSPPARPFAGGSFLPVGGRYSGMSLLEIMETTHDTVKVLLDQNINSQDLSIGSPGWYRPSGGMNPEVLRIEPFTLNPLQNPQQDVVFPQIGNPQAMGMGLNLINMLGGWQDKITMVGDLQFGQVPTGASSALRTIGGMSLAMGQGEARPERILRRFFTILVEVYQQIHRLNQAFLPKDKQFRISGVALPGDDPYRKIETQDQIKGNFLFGFDANAFNTSKAALQNSLKSIGATLINPLTIQLGVVKAENIYNWANDYVLSMGQLANRYVTPPTPDAAGPKILAEEAIREIMNNQLPIGAPLEAGGPQDHMQKLLGFMEGPEFGLLTPAQVDLFRQYLMQVRKSVAAATQQAQTLAAAGQFAQQNGQAQGGGAPVQKPPQQAPNQPAPISGPGELQDESLPGAGGGANANAA